MRPIDPSNAVPFVTESVIFLTPRGNGTSGSIELGFITDTGQILTTFIGPQLAAEFAHNLDVVLSSIPQYPRSTKGGVPRLKVPGAQTTAARTVRYFGQDYPAEIVEALGVLMIRVNLIEQNLVDLFSALSGLKYEQAAALFYSTRSADARIDMIRTTVPNSNITTGHKERINEALSKVKSLGTRRNHLVHGNWSFKGDKFLVELFEPNKKGKGSDKTTHVSAKFINELATEYQECGLLLLSFADTVRLIGTQHS